MHAFFSFSFFLLLFLGLRGKTKAGERCRNKCKVGEKEGRNRATNKKGKEEEKVKVENVSYPLLETVTLICSVSSHTSAFARRSSLSLPPTQRSLCRIHLSPFLTLFLFHTLQSLTSTKTSHAQFGAEPVKLALNTHAHQQILL